MTTNETSRPRPKKTRPETQVGESQNQNQNRPRRERGPDVESLREWLHGLDEEVKATIHVNGRLHPLSIVTVDFGTPLKPFRLENDQVQELNDRLRKLAREIVGKDSTNIRISHDAPNGIYWASVG